MILYFIAYLLKILYGPNVSSMGTPVRGKMVASETKIDLQLPFWVMCFLFSLLLPSICFGEKLPIVSSIYPVADMVRQVGGAHVDVTVVLPAGASPHTFEPKPSMLKKFSSAKIFFMIGAGLEFWA